ncbi:MAG TPA: YkgJ family cysteine cluster protein [Methanoregulaceae archaeon]|nr:YkgJ family cysteine cluster protein [Methanoregulaceae archaeon]
MNGSIGIRPAPLSASVPNALRVTPPPPPFFARRIAFFEAELAELRAYPRERLAGIVTGIGFACDGCARCCTRQSNDHVFLLEEDADRLREVAPDVLVPAPDPELADREGRLYVSGYALATTENGDCVFLENGRCRHYAARPAICRVYPYMLHREPGADGRVDWRQLAGLGKHGEYDTAIPPEEAGRCADETIAYEAAFLEQMIGFYRAAADYFAANDLRHVQKVRDDRLRAHARGEPLELLVYHRGRFEPCRVEPRG